MSVSRKLRRDESGFTLIELLVIVAVITILAAVLAPKLTGYTNTARVSSAQADLAAMKSVVDIYAANEGAGNYPGNDNAAAGGIGAVLRNRGIQWTDGTSPGIRDPWGQAYRYYADNAQGTYYIVSGGPNGTVGAPTPDGDDILATSDSPSGSPLPSNVTYPGTPVNSAP